MDRDKKLEAFFVYISDIPYRGEDSNTFNPAFDLSGYICVCIYICIVNTVISAQTSTLGIKMSASILGW
jgi:hypothetical protein